MSTFDPAACAELIEVMTATSLAAADAIRRLHGQGGVRIKADGSPVTAADEAAEAVIHDGLAHLAPALPVISEEASGAREAGHHEHKRYPGRPAGRHAGIHRGPR